MLEPGTDAGHDPALALRVAAVAAEHGLPSAARLARRHGRGRRLLAGPVATRACATRWSGCSPPAPAAIPALEALDQRGLFVRLVPEWAAVRNRPQRNAYHRFTVDRHLLEAASPGGAPGDQGRPPRPPSRGSAPPRHREGLPRGPHRRRGPWSWARWAGAWGSRPRTCRSWSGSSAITFCSPKRPHDATSTTLPPSRPWPEPCNDRAQLDLLAALTEADSLATGPAAWGQWKAGLVADLVRRVTTYLSGGEVGRTRARS